MIGRDLLVKPPLGVLWFGGPSERADAAAARAGPGPEVAAGRAVILGMHLLRAMDIYTGRLLWEAPFPDIGQFYNTGAKQMGTHETGPNYASLADAIYVITPEKCVALDAVDRQEGEGVSAARRTWRRTPCGRRCVRKEICSSPRSGPLDMKRDFEVNARVGAGRTVAGRVRPNGRNLPLVPQGAVRLAKQRCGGGRRQSLRDRRAGRRPRWIVPSGAG